MRFRTSIIAVLLLGTGLLLTNCLPILPGDEFEPSGSSFNLNPQLSASSIIGSTTNFDPTAVYGLDLTLASTASGTVTQTLPAGLIIRSRSSKYQHMLLVRDYEFSVPPGTETGFVLGVFCCNSYRSAPDDSAFYDIGPVTDNTDLQKIVAITKHKALNYSNTELVQRAVTMVTDGNDLSLEMQDSLNALPDGQVFSSGQRGPIPTELLRIRQELKKQPRH